MQVRKLIATAAVTVSTLLVGAGLTGCSTEEDGYTNAPQYTRVCEDRVTHERVDDSRCQGHSLGTSLLWYYILTSHAVPRVGTHVYGGTVTYPRGYSRSQFVKAPVRGGHLNTSSGYRSATGGSKSGYKSGTSYKSGSGSKSGGFGSKSGGFGGFGGGSRSFGGRR